MKPPTTTLASLFIILCLSCNTKNNTDVEKKDIVKKDIVVNKDTVPAQVQSPTLPEIPDFRTNQPFFADTKQLRQKRMNILKNFAQTVSGAGADYDTLVDINYDGYRDYILGYYGASGTGFKYRIAAYVFSKRKGNYFLDEQISGLVNPSFFIPEHKITGFYIGLGGGWGRKLEWIKNRWVLTKEFEVDNNGDSTIWEVRYPLTNKTEKVMRPFQMIPPGEILEWNSYF